MVGSSLARKAIKVGALPVGLGPRRGSRTVVVLLYHRVGAGHGEISVDRRTFERHMSVVAGRGLVRPLDDALEDGVGGVVVTIDDGYRDFVDHALPVLERYRVPAVLYLTTGNVGGSDPEALTWAALADAVSTGLITVGSHTHTHADLSSASEGETEQEMRRSKELIEDRLGVPCRHFAYPWSVASAASERAAHRFFSTAALRWKTNRVGAIDPYRLGRTPILRSDGQMFFRAKLTGRLDGEAAVYRLARRGPWRPR